MADEQNAEAVGFEPGRWFRVTLPDGRTGGGQVLFADSRAVALRLSAGLWTCAVGRLDLMSEPVAVEHLAVVPARLAPVDWLDCTTVPESVPTLHQAWLESGAPVVDAPLAVVLAALLALA